MGPQPREPFTTTTGRAAAEKRQKERKRHAAEVSELKERIRILEADLHAARTGDGAPGLAEEVRQAKVTAIRKLMSQVNHEDPRVSRQAAEQVIKLAEQLEAAEYSEIIYVTSARIPEAETIPDFEPAAA